MTDYEYALRVVTVAGQEFEIAHAVARGTLVALCGTVAVPQPGSRWAEAVVEARCEACERSMAALAAPARPGTGEPVPAPAPELVPETEPVPEPAPEPETEPTPAPEPAPAMTAGQGSGRRPALADGARALAGRLLSGWHRLGRGVQIAIAAGSLVVAVLIVVVLSTGGGFHADPSSPAFKNGYSYGHDLMGPSNDVPSSCTQANIEDPASADGKNFIAGCEAGYAARTP